MGEITGYKYTKEEIEEKIIVPKTVEVELLGLVEERLNHCGFFHRVFSRIKSAESLEHKYAYKNYDDNNKIQDLIGIRIDLYFEDDIELCRTLLSNSFAEVDWSSSDTSEEVFKATKINGVFRLPNYIKDRISPDTWNMGIDDTFEIQIKTMFFEGWHEIEHDLRYKHEQIWSGHEEDLGRHFNSILATLELCDKSITTVLDDLGHALYKSGNWEDMIRVHFHVKMSDKQLYPELVDYFNESYKSLTDNYPKRVYKSRRKWLIDALAEKPYKVDINVNTIVALINETHIHDEKVAKIMKDRDVYRDNQYSTGVSRKNYDLQPLLFHKVFQAKVRVGVLGSRIEDDFNNSVAVVYNWIRQKFNGLVGEIPESPATFYGYRTGYRLSVSYDPDDMDFKSRTTHLDFNVGARVWQTNTHIYRDGNGVYAYICNSYSEPDKGFMADQSLFFNYPRFYREISDNVGINDVNQLISKRIIVNDDESKESLKNLILSADRKMPIVLVISHEGENGYMNEEWLGRFKVADFKRTVWRHCHVYTSFSNVGFKLADELGIKHTDEPALYVIWPGFGNRGNNDSFYQRYDEEYIKNCSFDRHRSSEDMLSYDIVKGGQGFYHLLLNELRSYNVAGDVRGEDYDFVDEFAMAGREALKTINNSYIRSIIDEQSIFYDELVSENQVLNDKIKELERQVFLLSQKNESK